MSKVKVQEFLEESSNIFEIKGILNALDYIFTNIKGRHGEKKEMTVEMIKNIFMIIDEKPFSRINTRNTLKRNQVLKYKNIIAKYFGQNLISNKIYLMPENWH
jgi:hypothetical protein